MFSYYPRSAAEFLIVAEALLAILSLPSAPATLVARVQGALEALARAYVDAVAKHRAGISAQEAARAARDVGDSACDRKGMAFIQAVKYREGGEAVLGELRQSWGGEAPNLLFARPDADQVATLDRFFALTDARADLSLPKNAYEEFKAAHEEMKRLVRAEEAADAARDTLSAAVKTAERAFAPAYRFFIRELLFNEGEDTVRDNLPRFER